MALIGMQDVCWGFDKPPLLENISLQIEKGERVGLLGRNGVGKSTLFKILGGEVLPDSGEIIRQQGVVVTAMAQDVSSGFDGTIFDAVADGFGEKGRALAEHVRICNLPETDMTPALADRRDALQRMLDACDGWGVMQQVENALSRTQLDPATRFGGLSAGMKRRVLFARALAPEPDILLLDEPTNHLYIDTIVWMEDFILRHVKTVLFITHDRTFLKRIATRIMELERGRLVSHSCNYETFLERRQADLDAEEKQNDRFDKKLSVEEVWIRKGVKARRARNEGRVRALKKMREAHSERRQRTGNVRLRIQEAERTGKLVIEAQNISFSHGEVSREENHIVRDFSTLIMRGDKVGIIGPNGAGKTTLLKLLLKEISPQTGSVRHGTHLQPVYFDQLRLALDDQKTVRDNIGEGNDFITINDQKRHVIGYLKDFLFTPERCRTPVHVLSGGEKNRLLLAKLFARPANVLVMDEPTNDLDSETLELLEELLFDYQGTLLLVSHDRTFLNNVVFSTIAFEENGRIVEYAGGYDDWLIQRPQPAATAVPEKKEPKKDNRKPEAKQSQKLGFKEKRELGELPQKIEALESEQKALFERMADPLFYTSAKEEIVAVKTRLATLGKEIETAYLRWESLEERRMETS